MLWLVWYHNVVLILQLANRAVFALAPTMPVAGARSICYETYVSTLGTLKSPGRDSIYVVKSSTISRSLVLSGPDKPQVRLHSARTIVSVYSLLRSKYTRSQKGRLGAIRTGELEYITEHLD
jgi:hypothetical protein